jgi:excisionase family DNA binding protein
MVFTGEFEAIRQEDYMAGKLLTPEQAANRLAVSSRSIREWLRTGKLRGVRAGRLWRIRDRDIEEFLERGAEKQAGKAHTDDAFLEVIGCLAGEALSSQEIDRELYGKGAA